LTIWDIQIFQFFLKFFFIIVLSVFPNENARKKVVPVDASGTKLDCLAQRCTDATSKL
jgi:hypothetical protein